ncbi:alpha/beta hydrolase fold-domain-containing protein [Choanephora cucurbitarum]|nr:alpha/beta hydrolase fold-domain-containing protein [Choanephora cucurbitarum]
MSPSPKTPFIYPIYQEVCLYSKKHIYPQFEKNATATPEQQYEFIKKLRVDSSKPFVKTKLKETLKSTCLMNEINTTIFRPPGTEGQLLDVIILLHGGGWIVGDLNTYSKLATDICITSQSAVVFVQYTLSPEVRFPVSLEECYSVLYWISENGHSVCLNQHNIVVLGDSVGGNMATVLTMMAKDRGMDSVIKAQVLLYPVTSPKFGIYESHHLFSDAAYGLGKLHNDILYTHYFPSPLNTRYASPLLSTDDQLKGLPPAFVLTCEADILRDEGEDYASRLMAAGVDTVAIRVKGVIHEYLVDDYPDNSTYIMSLKSICDFIKSVQFK